MTRRRRRSFREQCYWCGADATGRDHVLPLAMFSRPAPTDLITVPACAKHNQALKLDEEYFRLLLVVTDGYDHPEGKKLWEERVRPRLETRTRLAKRLWDRSRLVSVIGPGGLFLGHARAIAVEEERVNRVIEKIVRGLYFHHCDSRLSGAAVEVVQRPEEIPEELVEVSQWRTIGSSVKYGYAIAEDEPRGSVWLIQFFTRILFVAFTLPAEMRRK